MVNMNVGYVRPARSLTTLQAELNAIWPGRQPDLGFVTGYKSAGNFSGHNPNNLGIVMAYDIGTYVNGSINEPDGRALADYLRTDCNEKLQYLIHDMGPAGVQQPMIAGNHTNWAWQAYTGADPHSNHIHLSIVDLYWGDPTNVPASVYDSTSPWGIAARFGATSQGGTITPITQKDGFDMASLADLRKIIKEEVATSSWGYKNPSLEKDDAYALLRATRTYAVKNSGDIAALRNVVDQIAKGQGVAIDYAQVKEAAAAGAAEALAAGVDLDATVTIRGVQ